MFGVSDDAFASVVAIEGELNPPKLGVNVFPNDIEAAAVVFVLLFPKLAALIIPLLSPLEVAGATFQLPKFSLGAVAPAAGCVFTVPIILSSVHCDQERGRVHCDQGRGESNL